MCCNIDRFIAPPPMTTSKHETVVALDAIRAANAQLNVVFAPNVLCWWSFTNGPFFFFQATLLCHLKFENRKRLKSNIPQGALQPAAFQAQQVRLGAVQCLNDLAQRRSPVSPR
jgi:hypothetical protein